MTKRWLVTVAASTLAACGISAVGQLGVDATNADAGAIGASDGASTSNDAASADAYVEAAACDGGAPVVFLPEDGGACPSGTTEEVVHVDAGASAGACSCGACTPTANPTCNVGAIAVDYGTGGSASSCASGNLAYASANEACTNFGLGSVTQAAYEKWPARTPTGGSCTATPVIDQTKATSAALRRCVAVTAEAACLPSTTAQKKCIESNAPCGGDYPNTITIGNAAAVSCAPCTCVRGAAKCVVEHFSDNACTQLRYQQDLDGVCQRTDDATNVQYFKVRAEGLTCVATAGAATAALTNPKTLCCAP